MSKREAFIDAIGRDTLQDFLHFIQLHKDASDPFDLEEILQELPRKKKEELWQKLNALLMDTLVANPVESWHKIDDDDSDDDMEVEGASEVKNAMEVIRGVTVVTTLSVFVVEDNMSYQSLLECAGLLNGILEALPRSESHVRLAIQQMCEAWWEKGLDKKEEFGKTAFAMLLAKSLEPKSTAADMTRLRQLHSALHSFDYNSEDSNEVRDLLVRCFMGTNHIKKEEGRRFLSLIFSWDVNFIKIIHGTIKNQIQNLPKSLMGQVADIYFRAWNKAPENLRSTIEETCIQDFMHNGIHLPRSSPVQPRVREILRYFHNHNLHQGVGEMLYRLYQPILWRALKAPNSEVRSNAAVLFVEVFPLRKQNTDADMDNETQKQIEELFKLLEDPQPLVRSAGIFGVCKITARYWEMIPPVILTDLMKKVIGELAGDVSSADVRCSVFKCLKILLENNLSHPLLVQMLPLLMYSLHDNSEKVRVAFVDLLLKIKAVRAAKFWTICPIDHLLAQLEIDSRPVCRRIVNLMFSSFFPVNQSEEIWCERCVALVQMNPGAARRFYQYAYEHTAPTNIAKLMLTLRRCLNACVQRTVRSENEENEDDNESEEIDKRNKSVLENVVSKEDATSVSRLLEIIVILWRSIKNNLDENGEVKDYTINRFASVLPDYFRVFKDDRCTVPLIILASFMPPSAIPTFSCSVLSKLRNLSNDAEEKKYSSLIDCLCRWGQVGHLLELILDWLSEAFPDIKKRKDSRKVRIQDTIECKPDLAIKYAEYLLTQNKNRECLMAAQTNKLNSLFKQLGRLKEVLCSFMKPSEGVTHILTEETSLRAFCLYCRLSIHLQYKFNSEGRIYLSVLEDTSEWVISQVLGILESGEPITDQQNKMAQQILQTYLTVCKDVVMVGLADSSFQAQLLQSMLSIIQMEKCCDCLPTFLSVLKEITEVCLVHKMNNASAELDQHLHAIQTCFHKAIEIAARRLRKQQDEALKLLQSIQVPVAQFVNTVQCWHMVSSEVLHGTLSTIIAAVVVEISQALRKISDPDEIATPASISELPPLSRCLMSVVIKTSSVLNSFLGELATCVSAEEIEGILSLTASLYIILVSSKGKRLSAAAKDIASVIYRKLKNHREVTMEDDDNIERAIYESSMGTLDQLLQP